MVDRKKTPDILEDLLGGAEPEPTKKPVDQPTSTPVHHKASTPAQKPTSEPVIQVKTGRPKREEPAPPVEAPPGERVKATFYLSAEVVEALEAGWIQLRRLTPKDRRGQVSKSMIVELAVQEALEDLDSKKERSSLARKANKTREER